VHVYLSTYLVTHLKSIILISILQYFTNILSKKFHSGITNLKVFDETYNLDKKQSQDAASYLLCRQMLIRLPKAITV